ncbi:universal stress protein [Candidatus Oleimmundimicrobium sp.]|uniref:universal stress protein n=1 Tax=Candidatus Oleimmundimicrobium sp. TaxID=3060597 RepID=UPI0027289362|nr:universal stress protein [Candidatus Oleimmundimicrobium sp.]MDO8886030.1 universal stress protein [Candidatus Oleimmundimicrobium sp.]
MEKILFPTDGSKTAERAREFAVNIAKATSAKIIVLSVAPTPTTLSGFQPAIASRFESELKNKMMEIAKTAKKKILDEGVKADFKVVSGDPSDRIVELAEEEKVDAIVMGTHGTTGLARFFIGSVADRVVRKAHCPIVLVPEKDFS